MLSPGSVVGELIIRERVASGGMGDVYRAEDAGARSVALKVVREERTDSAARFEREIEVAGRLRHPHVVGYVGQGTLDDGTRYLLQEWIDGPTLAARIDGDGLTPDETATAIAAAARALAAAHALGIIHRDVKPANLLLQGGDPADLRVVDFGIARLAGDEVILTRAGTAVGTPGYMAPEQARGDRDLDGKVDLFALGCVLYECLTGARAFQGRDSGALLAKVLLQDPIPLRLLWPGVPGPLEALASAMLDKSAARRPNATEVAGALDRLRPVSGARRTPVPATGRRAGDGPTDATRTAQPLALDIAVVVAVDLAEGEAEIARRAVGRLAPQMAVLEDGSTFVALRGRHPADLADRGAQIALSLHRALSDTPVAITAAFAEPGVDPLDEALDRAATLLAVSFADAAPDGTTPIRVDDTVVRALQSRGHSIRTTSGRHYLTPPPA